MKKIFTARRLVIGVIITILTLGVLTFSSYSLRSDKGPSMPNRMLNDITSWISNTVALPVGGVQHGFNSIDNLISTYQENKQMSAKVDELAQAKVRLQVMRSENKALKEQLKLTDTLTDYSLVNASVISRSPVNWQTQLIIDQGSNAGIKKNMPVMGSGGLVGRISQVSNTSAKVELLSDNSQTANRFAIRIATDNGEMVDGLITGFNQTKNKILMEYVTSDVEIKPGDKVTTSGLGGVTPAGLFVGTVSSVEANDYGLSKKIYIKPSMNFNNIPVVSVAIQK